MNKWNVRITTNNGAQYDIMADDSAAKVFGSLDLTAALNHELPEGAGHFRLAPGAIQTLDIIKNDTPDVSYVDRA